MNSVTLEPLYHRGEECIAIIFSPNKMVSDIIKKLPKAKWSKTHQCWYIPYIREHYNHLAVALQDKAMIEKEMLKQYLQQRKALVPLQQTIVKASTAKMMITYPLSEENLAAFTAFKNMLVLKKYSKNTVRNYCSEFHHLLRLLNKRNVNDLTKEQIRATCCGYLRSKSIVRCMHTLP